MKILLIAPVHRELEFLKQKDKKYFLKGQGQQSWVEALISLGHQVYVFRSTDIILFSKIVRILITNFMEKTIPRWIGRLGRVIDKFYFLSAENYLKNKKLLNLAQSIKPELVIISGGINSIFPSTIKKIKEKYRLKVLLFSGVDPRIGSSRAERTMVQKHITDVVVVNDRGFGWEWKKLGAQEVITLPVSSVDPKIHKRLKLTKQELKKYTCDVCFVGTLTKKRQERLQHLTNFNLRIWGDVPSTLGLNSKLKPFYQGTAHGEKMIKIYNSAKIALNFQQEMMKGGNMRMFEIAGCGAFQITDKLGEGWFRNGKEIVLYKNIPDLKRKILYYLSYEKERKKIADRGYRLAHKQYTYKKRFMRLFGYLYDN